MNIAILFVFLAAGCCAASELPAMPSQPSTIELKRPNNERLWKVSLVTLAAANLLDTTSSWGKCEASGFLAGGTGRFDGRSVAIKSALLVGLVGVEHLTGRHNPKLYRFFAVANITVGAGLTGVAMRNYTIQTPPSSVNCVAGR